MTRWKAIPIVIGVTVVMVCGGFLFAQTQQSPPPQGGTSKYLDPRVQHTVDLLFRDMDTDHDGRISKSEWMSYYEKQFNSLDKNGKGYLTRDDVAAVLAGYLKRQEE